MARPRKGKVLTLRPIRLDDDLWAECQRLGKVHGTINAGLRVAIGMDEPDYGVGYKTVTVEEVAGRPDTPRPTPTKTAFVESPMHATRRSNERPKRFERGIRPKGDGNR